MISQNTPNKLSRRNWLRNAGIATTGAVVLPSLLTGCSYIDDVLPNLGITPPLTPVERELYGQAADNLIRMKLWYNDLYGNYTSQYIFTAYTFFKSGEKPTNWEHILIDIFTDIGLGILEAALEELPGVGPAIAATTREIEKWAFEEKSGKVDAAFADFSKGYGEMHEKVIKKLDLLAKPGTDGNYAALQEAFKDGNIEFRGKEYTLKQLAQADFPRTDNTNEADDYDKLIAAALLSFKKNLWFAMFLKAGKLESKDLGYENFCNYSCHPTLYAEQFYKENTDAYLRGYYYPSSVIASNSYLYYKKWYFTFDGKELPLEATKILFKDSRPGVTINPNAFFTRDVVFKQFVRERTPFAPYFEIRKDTEKGPCLDVNNHNYQPCAYFDPEGDNYEYIAGDFSKLPNLT
jgi:hypothetical protein